ncbi:hypothetical protein SCT_1561 [Sulfuricella sp. T08]|uniref:hypothetical protein n=1 Tax=Sulfuricella sp. T08 TaxID=1632857 RepID=UPI000617A040|nr:hypothetical protein [Sulfuricella sp. T08]GAO36160.1 hypothetical protein SCT_1561 [Sulfuricella sp. T08]
MNNLKKLEKRILKSPGEPASQVFMELVKALEHKLDFNLATIYDLDYDDFQLTLDVLKDWRLDRYAKTRERLKALPDLQQKYRRPD